MLKADSRPHPVARRRRPSSSWRRCSTPGGSPSWCSRRRWRAPIVTRRKFDPEATLELVDRHRATGLCVVPVMFDRIMDLPDDVRNRYSGTLAAVRRRVGFADAPRRGHHVHGPVRRRHLQQLQRHRGRHDRHRHARDLRAAPDTAGRPADGTEIRILDDGLRAKSPPARSGRSSSATAPCSTATPRAPPRTSTTVSWPRATWATSTTTAGCSWWAATTR